MGTKTVKTCDVTGEVLSQPFYLGFKTDEGDIKLEVSFKIAQKFMLTLASRVDDQTLIEVCDEVFGKNWKKQLSN